MMVQVWFPTPQVLCLDMQHPHPETEDKQIISCFQILYNLSLSLVRLRKVIALNDHETRRKHAKHISVCRFSIQTLPVKKML